MPDRTVYGGRAAVSAAGLFRPDVALLDIGMPELDGYAAAKAIRQHRGGVDTTWWDPDALRQLLRGVVAAASAKTCQSD